MHNAARSQELSGKGKGTSGRRAAGTAPRGQGRPSALEAASSTQQPCSHWGYHPPGRFKSLVLGCLTKNYAKYPAASCSVQEL